MNVNDKRIVITGAASGIGAALLNRLTRFRCQILAVDRQPITQATTRRDQAQVTTLHADLSTEAGNASVFDAAQSQMGGIDIFIANAGFAHYGLAKSLDWQGMERLFSVNVLAPLYAITHMQQFNPTSPYMVVVTASAMAKLALPGYAHYAGTKAALDRFAQAYRHELPANGHLMLVYPIATRTQFFQKRAATDAPRPFPSQSAGFVANRIISGIKNNRQRVNPSPGFRIYGALTRLFPPLGRIYRAYADYQLKQWLKKQP